MITSDRIKTLTRPLKFKEKIFTSDFYSLIELHILLIDIYEKSLHAVTTNARVVQ